MKIFIFTLVITGFFLIFCDSLYKMVDSKNSPDNYKTLNLFKSFRKILKQ